MAETEEAKTGMLRHIEKFREDLHEGWTPDRTVLARGYQSLPWLRSSP